MDSDTLLNAYWKQAYHSGSENAMRASVAYGTYEGMEYVCGSLVRSYIWHTCLLFHGDFWIFHSFTVILRLSRQIWRFLPHFAIFSPEFPRNTLFSPKINCHSSKRVIVQRKTHSPPKIFNFSFKKPQRIIENSPNLEKTHFNEPG